MQKVSWGACSLSCTAKLLLAQCSTTYSERSRSFNSVTRASLAPFLVRQRTSERVPLLDLDSSQGPLAHSRG